MSSSTSYRWKSGWLGNEYSGDKLRRRKLESADERDTVLAWVESLREQVESLRKQVFRLSFKRDDWESDDRNHERSRAPISRN